MFEKCTQRIKESIAKKVHWKFHFINIPLRVTRNKFWFSFVCSHVYIWLRSYLLNMAHYSQLACIMASGASSTCGANTKEWFKERFQFEAFNHCTFTCKKETKQSKHRIICMHESCIYALAMQQHMIFPYWGEKCERSMKSSVIGDIDQTVWSFG